MVRRILDSFSPSRFPRMTRASYRRELISSMTFPVALSLVEGGVAGVLAKKVFDVSALQLAMITAAKMFANLTSFLWARLSRGRRKVPMITGLMLTLTVVVGAIALLPISPLGAWLLTGLVVLARVLMAGIVTVRSTVWRHNYPRHVRGQITAKLTTLLGLILLAAPLLGSLLLDFSPSGFRLLYPLGMAIGLIGVVEHAGLRLRGERALLRRERAQDGDGGEAEDPETPELARGPEPAARPGVVAVLRDDPLFRRYLVCQFLAGLSNMMLEPVVIDLVTTRTESLPASFLLSIGLTQALPALLMITTLPMWARLLDRVHITRFRAAQAWLWVAWQLLLWAGAIWTGSLVGGLILIALGRVIIGVARGGGVLAWNLGHNDFARQDLVAIYMGIHATLTGVRGAFAPFLGMALYTGWNPLSVAGWTFPGFEGLGGHVFLFASIFSTASMIGFIQLDRHVSRLRRAADPSRA
jgi:MFS family permease